MNPQAEGQAVGPGSDSATGLPPLPTTLLHEVFRRSARRWPDAVAFEAPPGPGRSHRSILTYAELDRLSDRLAAWLRPFVQPDSVVALLLPRTEIEFAVAQLAVLKAGAAYACLDAAFPDRQVVEILSDSESRILLTDATGVARSAWSGVRALDCRRLLEEATADLTETPNVQPSHLAYLIYTSGTTGRPKGVMIEHASIVNLVESDRDEFHLGPGDRVAQGSSAAYDSSVEELWLAWGSGATAVVMDDEAARLGPDLIPWLQQERITVLCPPPTLLRTTGCDRPDLALPDLRLLYVGGEALPSDVAERWGRGRLLVNGYGPTECTVTSVRGRIEIGAPITIGRPVRGFTAWIVDESLQPVAEGAEGELCLGGVGLARGYRNLPEVTAEKFPIHPQFGRIYRTGDLVSRGPNGVMTCHGRVDAQVKIRGYRIELEAVESRLSECPGVRSAACAVRGDSSRQMLVGYIVADDPASPPEASALKDELSRVLPAYMVPSAFVFLADLPRTVGGKIQRRALPEPLVNPVAESAADSSNEGDVSTLSEVERILLKACAQALNRPELGAAAVHADFFNQLNGDSLTAALWVSRLREHAGTAALTVRDVYEHRTPARLAVRAAEVRRESGGDAPASSAGTSADPIGAGGRFIATCLQLASIAWSTVVFSLLLYWGVFHALPWLAIRVGPVPIILGFPGIVFAVVAIYTPVSIAIAVLLKRLLIGRYQPGREPVWGSFYLKHWAVQNAVRRIPWNFLEGTEFLNMTLRALGARVGRRVHIHRGVDVFRGAWDLLEIGDDVTLSQEASLRLVELEDRQLVIGPVVIESGATLEVRAGVGCHTRVGAGASLTALSSLPRGGSIPAGERWDGIPARCIGTTPKPDLDPAAPQPLSPVAYSLLLILARLALGWILALPLEFIALLIARWTGTDVEQALDWLESPTVSATGVLTACIAMFAPVPLALLLEAALCRALGRINPGTIPRSSAAFLRVWMKTGMVQSAGNWLYGTLLWPFWLRLAGAKIGKDCEISTIIDVVPEMLEIGNGSFLADGIYLAGPRIHQGCVTLAPIRISERTFLGNGVVIPAGEKLPPDLLLGVLTVADARFCRQGSAWFGHPAFELPRREVLEVDAQLTHQPSVLRRANRWFWEGLRFLVPFVPAAVVPLWCSLLQQFGGDQPTTAFFWLGVPAATAIAGLTPCLVVIALKWLVLGRVKPGVHPLWSCWASRWDFVCLAWSLLARDVIGTLDGTLVQAWFLRLLGVSVGRGVVLGPGFAQDIPDPDMLHLGDCATVDGLFQAHTFEDRVLKIDRVSIGAGATIGINAVLLYGSEIGDGARVEPHSVVMKRERLLPGHVYLGCPTRRVR